MDSNEAETASSGTVYTEIFERCIVIVGPTSVMLALNRHIKVNVSTFSLYIFRNTSCVFFLYMAPVQVPQGPLKTAHY